ncbi:MAG: M23 family metallopeptidase [Blastocatellia bacterium]
MRKFIVVISISFIATLAGLLIGCSERDLSTLNTPVQPPPTADSFSYPIGRKESVTQAKDADEWYNALDFGDDNHLGEDWNKNTGGNTDCGEPVYSIANGVITYAADAGPGWGNVVIVTHTLADGTKVQSLYGHLQEITKTRGEIKKREQIGKVGNANGRYLCHLHFEIREETCPSWDAVFVGYSPIRYGWLDPSDFIDRQTLKHKQ